MNKNKFTPLNAAERQFREAKLFNWVKKGFTLIELLVVIAIIGILAAVLLVNLAGTRDKAKDSAIKLEMNQIRTAVESFAISQPTFTYVGACAAGPPKTECDKLQDSIKAKLSNSSEMDNFSTGAWCVQYTLNNGGPWCLDATGYAGAPIGGVATCLSSTRCRQ